MSSPKLPVCKTGSDVPPTDVATVQSEASSVVLVDLYSDMSIDPVYQAKSKVLNRALQEVGMGKYQVKTEVLFKKRTVIDFAK